MALNRYRVTDKCGGVSDSATINGILGDAVVIVNVGYVKRGFTLATATPAN